MEFEHHDLTLPEETIISSEDALNAAQQELQEKYSADICGANWM